MIDNKYTLMDFLARGGSSKVFLAKDTYHNKCVVKIIRKDKNYAEGVAEKMLLSEHEVLQRLHTHPNIINSYDINFDGIASMDDEHMDVMYNVLEFAENGPLSHFIRYTGAIEEDISRLFILQVCNAIEYIHSEGYAHLDIKLENILLDKYFNIKVADMGASVFVRNSNELTDKRRGTLLYMAPEVLDNTWGKIYNAKKADVYSLGITLFVMLTGEFPNPHDLIKNSSTEDSDTHEHASCCCEASDDVKMRWNKLSYEVQDLIRAMTHMDPERRPSISQILCSPWLTQGFWKDSLSEVYSEMQHRAEYMLAFFQQQQKQRIKLV